MRRVRRTSRSAPTVIPTAPTERQWVESDAASCGRRKPGLTCGDAPRSRESRVRRCRAATQQEPHAQGGPSERCPHVGRVRRAAFAAPHGLALASRARPSAHPTLASAPPDRTATAAMSIGIATGRHRVGHVLPRGRSSRAVFAGRGAPPTRPRDRARAAMPRTRPPPQSSGAAPDGAGRASTRHWHDIATSGSYGGTSAGSTRPARPGSAVVWRAGCRSRGCTARGDCCASAPEPRRRRPTTAPPASASSTSPASSRDPLPPAPTDGSVPSPPLGGGSGSGARRAPTPASDRHPPSRHGSRSAAARLPTRRPGSMPNVGHRHG